MHQVFTNSDRIDLFIDGIFFSLDISLAYQKIKDYNFYLSQPESSELNLSSSVVIENSRVTFIDVKNFGELILVNSSVTLSQVKKVSVKDSQRI